MKKLFDDLSAPTFDDDFGGGKRFDVSEEVLEQRVTNTLSVLSNRNLLDFKYGASKGQKRLLQFLKNWTNFHSREYYYSPLHNKKLASLANILDATNESGAYECLKNVFNSTYVPAEGAGRYMNGIEKDIVQEFIKATGINFLNTKDIHVIDVRNLYTFATAIEMLCTCQKLIDSIQYHGEPDFGRLSWKREFTTFKSNTNMPFVEYLLGRVSDLTGKNLTYSQVFDNNIVNDSELQKVMESLPAELSKALKTYNNIVVNPNPKIQKAVDEKREIAIKLRNRLTEISVSRYTDYRRHNLVLSLKNRLKRVTHFRDNYVVVIERENPSIPSLSHKDIGTLKQNCIVVDRFRTAYDEETLDILLCKGEVLQKFYDDCVELLKDVYIQYNRNLVGSILCQLLYNRGNLPIEDTIAAYERNNANKKFYIRIDSAVEAIHTLSEHILQYICGVSVDTLQPPETEEGIDQIVSIIDDVLNDDSKIDNICKSIKQALSSTM